jgi:hypothetical protein
MLADGEHPTGDENGTTPARNAIAWKEFSIFSEPKNKESIKITNSIVTFPGKG